MGYERTSVVLFLSRVSTAALGFLGTIYYARTLGPAIIGVFFLVQSLVGVLSVPADLGVQGAAEKRISEGGDNSELFTSALLIMAVSFGVISVLVLLMSKTITEYLGSPLIWELLLLLFATVLSQLVLSLLRGELKIEISAILEGVRAIVTIVMSVALILYGLEVKALIFGGVVGSASILPLAWIWIDSNLSTPSLKHLESIYSFSKYNMLVRSSGLVYGWIDVLVIGFFLSEMYVGVYEIAWRVSAVSILASGAIAQVVFPNFSRLFAEGDKKTVEDTVPSAITYSLLIPIAIFFGSLPLSTDLLSLVYGPAFGMGGVVLILLMAERTVHSFHNIIFNILMAGDKPATAFKISAISIIANVSLNIILIPLIGIVGAAIAMLSSYILNASLYYLSVPRLLDLEIRVPVKNIFWMVASGALMAVIVWLLKSTIAVQSLVSLGVLIGVGGVVYFVLLITNPDFRSMMKEIFSSIIN
ncbi:hypothetical protein HTG_01000 [Natrinema mahii]|nr:hypothetical protein HTG_01000 [Natrinema mahii]